MDSDSDEATAGDNMTDFRKHSLPGCDRLEQAMLFCTLFC